MSIVIVEDTPSPSAVASSILESFGPQAAVSTCVDLRNVPAFDVVVLSAECATHEGGERCRRMRDAGYDGAIVVVGVDRRDGIAFLEAGADDFVRRPPVADELVARIRAALRRAGQRPTSRWGDLEVDRLRHLVYVRGKRVELTAREYALLASLVEAQGGLISRQDLLARVWGDDRAPVSNLVEAHLSRLRSKLGRDSFLVATVRGAGYRLVR